MVEFLFKIWWMIVLLPFFIVEEGSDMFASFLKKRNIYNAWDMWHTALVFFIILLIVLWVNGFRP
jgi:hypothetical protein